MTWYAKGVGAAMSGDVPAAKAAEAQLAACRDRLDKPADSYWSKQVEIQRLQVAAFVSQQEGKHEEALRLARAAADLEDSTEKSPVTPGAVTPARENYAQLLLAQGLREQARAEFEAVLKVAPGRRNALAGAQNSGTAKKTASKMN
jgi:hypothetical protein